MLQNRPLWKNGSPIRKGSDRRGKGHLQSIFRGHLFTASKSRQKGPICNQGRGPFQSLDFQGRKVLLDRISKTYSDTVKELKLNEGISDPRLRVYFHTLRHTYASWMIEEGADLYTVQKLLGHKTNVMTQRYAHMSESRLRDATKALSASLKPQPEAGQVVNLTK